MLQNQIIPIPPINAQKENSRHENDTTALLQTKKHQNTTKTDINTTGN